MRHELSKLKSSKATGLDKIPAKLLKDASSVIAKPITYLINLTISSGEIPSQWKEAKVTPIFKAGKKDDENNYREISVLPLVSKVMERAVQVQLLAFFEVNKVLSVYQSGFCKKRSTETAVVHLVDHILEHMDKQQLTGAAFIDLKKAFDLVDHKCLLHKLEHYGVRGHSLGWFRNSLAASSICVPVPFLRHVEKESIPVPLVLYAHNAVWSLPPFTRSLSAPITVYYAKLFLTYFSWFPPPWE